MFTLVAGTSLVPALAAPPQTELTVFRSIDPRVIQHLDDAAQSDASGAIGNNRAAFLQIGLQNQSSWIVPNALLKKDESKLDRAVRILEYGFDHQKSDGSFEFSVGSSGTADTELSRAGNAAFFYADVGHTLALLSESPWYLTEPATAGIRARIAKLTPKIGRGLDRLASDSSVLMSDQAAVNRTLNYGLAYYLVGTALDRSDAVEIGKTFVKQCPRSTVVRRRFPRGRRLR